MIASQWTGFYKIETSVMKVSKAGTYLFKVINGNTRTMCEVYSKLTIKTPEYVIDWVQAFRTIFEML